MSKIIIDFVVIGLLALPYFIFERIPPAERLIWRDDRSIMYPMSPSDMIPNWALPIFALVIPLIILIACLGVQRFRNRRLLVVFVGLALSLMVTVQVTTLVKAIVGRPRPDFLDRCKPDPRIVDRIVCQGITAVVNEGRKSFPSGHASSSFAGLGYVGFFLAGQLSIYDGRGQAYRLLIALLPFLVAAYVGLTRIVDYRHHWQDVLGGAILGTVVAYLSYRVYFPSIMGRTSNALLEDLSGEEERKTEPQLPSETPIGSDAV